MRTVRLTSTQWAGIFEAGGMHSNASNANIYVLSVNGNQTRLVKLTPLDSDPGAEIVTYDVDFFNRRIKDVSHEYYNLNYYDVDLDSVNLDDVHLSSRFLASEYPDWYEKRKSMDLNDLKIAFYQEHPQLLKNDHSQGVQMRMRKSYQNAKSLSKANDVVVDRLCFLILASRSDENPEKVKQSGLRVGIKVNVIRDNVSKGIFLKDEELTWENVIFDG